MKSLLALILLVPTLAMAIAAPYSRSIDASVTNIPDTFSTASGSLVFTIPDGSSNVKVLNLTSCGIALNGFYQSDVPSNSDVHNMYVLDPTNVAGVIQSNIYVGGRMFVRSVCDPAAAITTGTVVVEVW